MGRPSHTWCLVVGIGLASCTPVFLPVPDPLPPLPHDLTVPGVIVARQIVLTYQLDPDGALVADYVERRLTQVVTPAGRSLARFIPEDGSNSVVMAAAARLRPAQGAGVEIHPPPGQVLELPEPHPGDWVDLMVRRRYRLAEALPPWPLGADIPTQAVELTVRATPGVELAVAAGRGTQRDDAMVEHRRDGATDVFTVRRTEVAGAAAAGRLGLQTGGWVVVVPKQLGTGSAARAFGTSYRDVAQWLGRQCAPAATVDPDSAGQLRASLEQPSLGLLRGLLHPMATAGLLQPPPRPFAELARSGATPLEAAVAAAAASSMAATRAAPAYVALVALPGEVPPFDDLPGLYAFQQAVVARRASQSWTFADPACTGCGRGEVGFALAGGEALVLVPGAPERVAVPLSAAQRNDRHYQFAWELSTDGTLHGNVLAELHGASAALVRAGLLAPNAAAARAEVARQLLFDGSGPAVQPVDDDEGGSSEDAAAPAAAEAESGSYAVRLELSATAAKKHGELSLTSAALAGAAFPWNVGESTGPGQVLLPGPLRSEASSTVALPADSAVQLPKPLRLQGPFGTYEAKYEQSEHILVFTRRLVLKSRAVPGDQLPALRAFVAKIRAFDVLPVVVPGGPT